MSLFVLSTSQCLDNYFPISINIPAPIFDLNLLSHSCIFLDFHFFFLCNISFSFSFPSLLHSTMAPKNPAHYSSTNFHATSSSKSNFSMEVSSPIKSIGEKRLSSFEGYKFHASLTEENLRQLKTSYNVQTSISIKLTSHRVINHEGFAYKLALIEWCFIIAFIFSLFI